MPIPTEIRRLSPFTIVPVRLIDDPDLGSYEKLIYMVLCRFADNQTKHCFPSLARVAELAKCSRPTVVKSIRKLIEMGWVKKFKREMEHGQHYSNIYVLTDGLENQELTIGDGGVVNHVYHPSKGRLPYLDLNNYNLSDNDNKSLSESESSDSDAINNTSFKALILEYQKLHKQFRGFSHPIDWGRDMAIMKRLAGQYEEDCLRRMFTVFIKYPKRVKTSLRDFENAKTTTFAILRDQAKGTRR